MEYGFSSVSPSLWSHANSFQCKTNTGAYRMYLHTSSSPGAARIWLSLRTYSPSPNSVMETDDQHSKSQPRAGRAPQSSQPLQRHRGSPSVQLVELLKDQGRNRVSSAGSFQEHPGPSDLCVCVFLGWTAQLCGPDARPKAASLLPSLRCEFPSAWLNSYSISQAQPDPFPPEPFRLILLQKVSARIFVSIKLLISYLHHFCYSILGQ